MRFLNDLEGKRETYSVTVTAGTLALNVFKDKIDNIYDWLLQGTQFQCAVSRTLLLLINTVAIFFSDILVWKSYFRSSTHIFFIQYLR
jgi:hypothetical protein